jgi:adenylate kinase
MKWALVLLGPPGSGKGTLSRFLTQWLGIPQISTGDMLRDEMHRGSGLGRSIAGIMRSGKLVSDELVNLMVAERISGPDCAKGFILDGYPRTIAQADKVKGLIEQAQAREVVIHLVVDYNEIISRMSGRRVCPVCGTLYNVISSPPIVAGICDLDGARLMVREDDREDVVRARLVEYDARTAPLVDYFRSSGRNLVEIQAGHRTPEEIFAQVKVGVETFAEATVA